MLLHTLSLPEGVGSEGSIGVDVVMQPPLHGHVPVTHAVSHLHTEVCVVAVDVLDGSEIIFLLSCGISTEHTEIKKKMRNWYKDKQSTMKT